MAIKSRSVTSDGSLKRQMTMDEFKRWMKTFDADKDGRVSKEELREAIRQTGGWFSRWKSSRAVSKADANGNGFVDESEIENLADFAQKQLGIKIVQ